MLNTALLSWMSHKSQHTCYEEIILGRICCEEAPQVVPACCTLLLLSHCSHFLHYFHFSTLILAIFENPLLLPLFAFTLLTGLFLSRFPPSLHGRKSGREPDVLQVHFSSFFWTLKTQVFCRFLSLHLGGCHQAGKRLTDGTAQIHEGGEVSRPWRRI